jgi:hypothetical protein
VVLIVLLVRAFWSRSRDVGEGEAGRAILSNKRDYVIKVLLPFGSWLAKLAVIGLPRGLASR